MVDLKDDKSVVMKVGSRDKWLDMQLAVQLDKEMGRMKVERQDVVLVDLLDKMKVYEMVDQLVGQMVYQQVDQFVEQMV